MARTPAVGCVSLRTKREKKLPTVGRAERLSLRGRSTWAVPSLEKPGTAQAPRNSKCSRALPSSRCDGQLSVIMGCGASRTADQSAVAQPTPVAAADPPHPALFEGPGRVQDGRNAVRICLVDTCKVPQLSAGDPGKTPASSLMFWVIAYRGHKTLADIISPAQ